MRFLELYNQQYDFCRKLEMIANIGFNLCITREEMGIDQIMMQASI